MRPALPARALTPPPVMALGGVPVVVTTPPSQPVMIGGLALAAPTRARTSREPLALPLPPPPVQVAPLPPLPPTVRRTRLGSTLPPISEVAAVDEACAIEADAPVEPECIEAAARQFAEAQAVPVVMTPEVDARAPVASGSPAGRAPLHLIAEYTTPIVALAPAARVRWVAAAGAIAVLTIAAFGFAATRSRTPTPSSPAPVEAPAPAARAVEPAPRASRTAAPAARELVRDDALDHEPTRSRAAPPPPSPSIAPTAPIAPPAQPAPPRAGRTQAPPSRGAWDPEALFPKD